MKKRIWVRVLSWILVIVMLMGDVMPAYAAETEGITTEVEGASTEAEEGTGKEEGNSVEEIVTDTEEGSTEIDDIATGAENDTTDTTGEQSGEVKEENQTGETGDDTSSDSSDEQMGETESEGSGKEDDTTSMPSDETEGDSAPSNGTGGECSEEDGVVVNDSNSEEGVSDEKSDDTLLTDNLIVSATDDGIATIDVLDGSNGSDGSSSNPYILWMKDGKCTNNELIAYLKNKTYIVTDWRGNKKYYNFDSSSQKKAIYINGTQLNEVDINFGLNDEETYTVNQYYYSNGVFGIGAGWYQESNSSTQYLCAKTYHSFFPSISGAESITVNDISITTITGKTYTLANDILPTNNTIDILKEDFPITIKVAPVERMKQSISFSGVDLTVNQDTGEANVSWSNTTTSGNLIVTYQPVTYHKVTPSSNVEGVTYKFLNMDAEEGELDYSTDMSGNKLSYFEVETASNVSIEAVAPAGYSFVRWWKIERDGSKKISYDANPIETPISSDITFEAVFAPSDSIYVAKNVTKDMSYSEYELPLAFSSAASGDKIVLLANATLSESVSIPESVDFLIPYAADKLEISDNEDTLHANSETYVNDSNGGMAMHTDTSKCYLELDVEDNVSISIEKNARFVVGGKITGQIALGDGPFSGCTTQAFSNVELAGENSQIIIEAGGILSSCGFIYGLGKVVAEAATTDTAGGTIYQPFSVGEYHNGSYTGAIYGVRKTSPFNCYGTLNIRTDVDLDAGAKLYGYLCLYAREINNQSTVCLIGPDNALIQPKESTRIEIKYNEEKHPNYVNSTGAYHKYRNYAGHTELYIYGDTIINSMAIKIKFIIQMNVETSDVVFPIPYNYSINLMNGNLAVTTKYKIMPGSAVTINEGASLTIKENAGVTIYDGFLPTLYDTHSDYPYGEMLTEGGYSESGHLYVGGTLNVEAGATLLGKIETLPGTSTCNGKIIIAEDSSNTTTLTDSEVNEGVMQGETYIAIAEAKVTTRTTRELTAQIWNPYNGDNGSGAWENLEKGKTYYAVSAAESEPKSSYTYVKYTGTKDSPVATTTTVDYVNPVAWSGHWVCPEITFDCNCTTPHTSITAAPGADITAPTCVSRTGYTFAGWYTEEGGKGTKYFEANTSTMLRDEITLYAHWVENTYTLAFEGGSGSYSETVTGSVESISDIKYAQEVTLPEATALSIKGHTFAGWKIGDKTYQPGNVVSGLSDTAGATVIAVAQWEPNSHTIQFDLDGGKTDVGETIIATLPAVYREDLSSYTYSLSKNGYTFGGWYTGKNGTGTRYLNDGVDSTAKELSMPDSDLLLYAHWVENPYYVKVSVGEGSISKENWLETGNGIYQYTFTMNSSEFTLPVPEKTGYTFDGWTGENVNKVEEVSITPTDVIASLSAGDDTLEYVANYEAKKYTIQYDGNGGNLIAGLTEGTANKQIAVYDQEIQLTYAIYTRDGYTFVGWSTDKDAIEAEYSLSQILSDNLSTGEDITLYAVWTVNSYEAKFYLDEDSEPFEKVSYNYGAEVVPVDAEPRDGYRFDYWYYLNEDDEVKFFTEESDNKMPVGGISLYAHWTIERYTIKFMDGSNELSSQIVEFGDTFSAPANPEKTGHEFTGWDWEIPTTIPDLGEYGTVKIVNATWNIEQYTLKFVDTDGTELFASITQKYGSAITPPAAPEKSGYTFKSWNDIVPDVMPDCGSNNAEKIFIAQWDTEKYDVTVHVGNGTINETNWTTGSGAGEFCGPQYTIEDKYLLPTPTRTGYEFTGWTLISNTITLTEENGNYYIPVGTTGDVEILAKWTPKTITVKLDAGKGTFENHAGEVSVAFDTAYGSLPTPVLEGYDFLGWYDCEQTEEASDDSHKVTEETVKKDEKAVLYAHWEICSYTITFDTNGGSEFTAVTKEYGTELQVSDPTREGYTFAGWYQTENEEGELSNSYTITTMPAKNMTLHAGWTPIVYTLELDANNGSLGEYEAITYTVEDTVESIAAKLPTPERMGYSFAKWNGIPSTEFMPANTVKLIAEWSINTYDLKFFIEGNHRMTLKVEYGTLLDNTYGGTIKVPSKTGYTFDGWYTTESSADGVQCLVEGCKVTMNEGMSLYARYKANAYTIKFDANKGTSGTVGNVSATYDETVTWPENAFVRKGYTFANWNTKADGSGTAYDAETITEKANLATGAVGDSEVTVYAIWSPITYTVEFDGNGAESGNTESITINYDKYVVFPECGFTKTGYIFAGWQYQVNGMNITGTPGSKQNNLTSIDGGKVTIKAQWIPIEYTVEFDLADGEGSIDACSVKYDAAWNAPTEKPTKSGYDFTGWKISGDTSETIYAAGASMPTKLSADPEVKVTLIAQWTPQQYDITLHVNDDAQTTKLVKVTYGQSYAYGTDGTNGLSTLTREGYKFDGWYVDETFTSEVVLEDIVEVKHPTQLYAKWTAEAYKITYLNSDGWNMNGLPGGYSTGSVPEITAKPTKAGYTFTGWKKDNENGKDIGEKLVIAQDSIGDLTFWLTYKTHNYTVSFDANGGEGTMKVQNFIYDQNETELSKNTFTKDGYLFKGWATDKDAAEPKFSDEQSVKNITAEDGAVVQLYAVWKPITYTVIFDGDHATGGAVAEKTVSYDTEFELPECEFTKTGYTFKNWLYLEDKTAKPGDKLSNLASEDGATITIKAVWEKDVYTITLNPDGGEMQDTETVIQYSVDSDTITLPKPEKTGYTFVGWSNGTAYVESILTGSTGDMQLTAEWTANSYTVSFDSNGGDGIIVDQEFIYDQDEIALTKNTFTKRGYIFTGWARTPNATNAEFADEQLVQNLTSEANGRIRLYAVWRANTYTVVFNGDGADSGSVKPIQVIYDQGFELPECGFAKTGYTFKNWLYSGIATIVCNPGDTLVNLTSKDMATVTIQAVWEKDVYSITLDSAGGNIENPELEYSVDSETIILPEITKTGYTFKGWSNGNSYVESIPKGSTGNVELTAEWAANKYKVAFDANGGEGTMEMMELVYDQEPAALTKNSFTRTGYTFAGWKKGDVVQTIAAEETEPSIYTDGQEVSNLTANDGEIITLYAVWTPNKYRIHFDGNGHTEGTVASVEAVYDAAVTWPENGYNKVGYLFAGWNTKADGTGNTFEAGKATSAANLATGTETDTEVTLYAMWNPIAYSIEFNGNGENSGSMSDLSLKYDEQISLTANDFAKNGYHFAGWATEADGEVVYEDEQKVSNLTTENNKKVTLYAVWTANTYTIEFDGNGATGGTTVSKSFTYDTQDTLTFNGYERTGYTFIGWSLSANSTTASYTDGQEVGNLTSVDGNKVTLYAIWTANTYTVKFDGNGATSGETASKTFTYDRNAALSANGFVRIGYTFGGWTLDKDGAGTVYADKQSVKNLATGSEQNKEIVLYAVWNANTYTVVFGKNNGTGSMESQQLTYDQETNLNVNTSITRTGYTFLGWDTDLNAVTPKYPQTMDGAGNVVGAAVKNLTPIPNGSVYLYAIWQANTYTAEFMLNSPVETADSTFGQTDVVFDSNLVLPTDTPEIEGYIFNGWYTAPTDGTRVSGLTKVTTEAPVYYAQWTIKTNTITLMLEDCEMTGDANWSVVTKDGKKQASYKANYATAVPIPPASVKTGYSFVKWQNESGEEFIFDDNTKMPSDNLTLYPVWQINQYTITFRETGDTVIAPITQDYETPVEAPEDPVKEGHTFKGWDTKIPDTMPAENVTIKAIWTINSYDVIYENTGETTIPSIEVVYAEEVSKPTVTPVYKGYEFKHWSLTANGDEVEFPVKMPAEDLRIYAVYDSYLDWILTTDITVEEEFLLAREYFQKLNDTQIVEYKQTAHWNEFSAKIKEISTISLRQSVIDAQTVTNDILSKVAFTEECEGEQTTKIIDLAEMKVFDEELKANPPKIEGMIKEDQYAAINMLNVEFMTALFDHDEIVSIVADDDTEPDKSLKEHVLTGNTIASSGTLASDQFNIMLIIAWAALDPDSSQQDFMNYLQSQMTTLKLEALDGKSLYITAKAESPEGVQYEATYALEFYSETHDLIYDFDGGNATEYQTTAKYEDTVTLTTPVKRGYTFEGWTSEDVTITKDTFVMGKTDVNLKAHWTLDSYKISLNLGNGDLIEAQQNNWPDNAKNYDALTGSIVLPDKNQIVAPSGYVFGGWYVDDATDAQMNVILNPSDTAFVLEDIVFTAKWIPIEYTLKLVLADEIVTEKFTVETINIELPIPERYGYIFEGWDGELRYPMPANDITLTAQWKAKEIPVILYLNDGTDALTIEKVLFDGNFGNLPTPEREGYGFDGWYTAAIGGEKYDGNKNVTSEALIELYAHWIAGSYTINYTSMEDAVNHADNPSSYVVDTEVELKAPTKTGYTFLGWSGSCVEEKSGKYYIVVGTTGTQTVTANWQINQYKITFDSNGGNEIEAIEADYLEMVIAPDEPSREGYTFAGWFAGDIQYFANGTSVKMPLNGLNLNAKWNINSHSITFLKADGSIHDVNTYNYSQTMEPKTADEIEGYTFIGWFDADGIRYFATETGEEKAEKMPDKDLTVTAKYRINQYTFSFNTECETIIDEITRDYASVINAPDEPVKTGHTFLGWFDSEDREYFEKDKEGIAKVETVTAKDVELTAKWEVNKYSFVFMDGELEHAEITADYGTAVSEPTEPTKIGYIFAGWDQEVPTSMPAENKVFYAQWNAIRYAVTFNSNSAGNIALPENMSELAYDTSYAIPELIPERTGYTFKGWKTDALAEETIDEIYNLTVNNEQTVTLYASWEAKTYTVTFDANGGTVEPSSKEVTYDDVCGELPVPEWEGYAFSGWTDGTTIYTESTVVKITEDQTLTAQWTEKGDTPYKVIHHLQNLADDEYTKEKEVGYTGKTNGTANATAGNYTGFVLNTEKSTMSGTITGDGELVLNLYYDRMKYKVTWNVADTSVEEFYKYEAMPEYKGEKDFTDDHGIHTFTAWDKKIEKAETDVVYTALYEVDYEASIGEVTYITLEKAISKAKSGETVRLDKDITLSEDLTVPAGVNLLLPCIDDDYGYNLVDKGRLKFNHDGTSTAGGTGVGPYAKLYRTLTIPEGVTLNVKGNVLVNSVSGRPVGGTADMDITGGYAVIELNGDIIVKNGGNLDCFGYVRGAGKVTAENGGSVGDLFIVRHWRGGTQAFAMYQSIMNYGTKDDPINRQVYPMNEYDCHNIETDVIVKYGASYDGLVKMCANAGDGNAYYYTRFPQVNVSNGMIRLVSEDGYVVRTYDKEEGKDIYTIYGGAKFAESSLNIAGVSLTTKDFLYPMDGDYWFELYDGNYSFVNDFKFLPGGSMVVHSGSTLKIEDDVFVAFYDEFNDKPNTGNTQYPIRDKMVLKIEEGAKFINGGTFGGSIVTESPDILIGDYPKWGITTMEANGYCGSPATVNIFHDLFITRAGYDWRYGDPALGEEKDSIIWIGADYTALNAALSTIPDDLKIYSDETVEPLKTVTGQIVYGLGKDKQSLVDDWTKAILNGVENLKLRVVKVVFNANGGTCKQDSMNVTYGDAYGNLPEAEYYGYIFLGWFDADNMLVTAEHVMKKTVNQITLTAKWEEIPADYTKVIEAIAAIPQDMTGYTEESVKAVYDAQKAVDMTLGLAQQKKVDAMADAILDAIEKLERVQIVVSFDSNGGEAVEETFTLRYGDLYPYDALPTPNREGFEFVAWYTAKEGGSEIKANTKVTSVTDVVLYAKWLDSSSNEPADYSPIEAAKQKIPADLRPYTAAGVNKLNEALDAVVPNLMANRQDDINAWAAAIEKAVEELEFKTITVYFDPAGGVCSVKSIQVTYGTECESLPVASKEYSSFLGWYTAKEGGVKVEASELSSKLENITLYAQYELLPADYSRIKEISAKIPTDLRCYSDESVAVLNAVLAQIERGYTADKQSVVDRWADELEAACAGLSYRMMTMTYDAQGGKVSPKSTVVQYNSAIKGLPTPELAYNEFDGWYTEAEGGEKVTEGMIVTKLNDFSIYAHWIQLDADYTKVYEALAKVPAEEEWIYYTDESIAELKEAIEAVQYGLNAGYQSQVNNWAGDINFARQKLQGKRVTITFEYNGGTGKPLRRTVSYGSNYGNLPQPTKEGYKFIGWYNKNVGGEKVEGTAKVLTIQNHTLYARWSDGKADYTAVENAIAKIPVDLHIYTEESVNAVEDAVNAVVYELSDTEQPRVDAYAEAIEKAINGLVRKPEEPTPPECTDDFVADNCPSKHLKDVDHTRWYHLDVDYVVENGLMRGTGKNVFGINDKVTRGMFVEILYRLSGQKATQQQIANCNFKDVSRNAYFADAVAWAEDMDITTGVSPTMFKPYDVITREQAMAMLYRYAVNYMQIDIHAGNAASRFKDEAQIKGWAMPAVSWGSESGIITGITLSDGSVIMQPQGSLERSQAASIIHRFCKKYVD